MYGRQFLGNCLPAKSLLVSPALATIDVEGEECTAVPALQPARVEGRRVQHVCCLAAGWPLFDSNLTTGWPQFDCSLTILSFEPLWPSSGGSSVCVCVCVCVCVYYLKSVLGRGSLRGRLQRTALDILLHSVGVGALQQKTKGAMLSLWPGRSQLSGNNRQVLVFYVLCFYIINIIINIINIIKYYIILYGFNVKCFKTL